MKSYKAKIPGSYYKGDKTVIVLESVGEGIAAGDAVMNLPQSQRSEVLKWGIPAARWERAKKELVSGDEKTRKEMQKIAEDLAGSVIDANPSLATGYQGLERAEEGFGLIASLALAGEERFMIRRRKSEVSVKAGAGDGAYRIIINTDVPWWGDATSNAGILGALVLILQNFGPVEIWIQQGWLGQSVHDGVTLFKLDYSGHFEPAHLAFWIGSDLKDTPFSYVINAGLGRQSSSTSHKPQVDCDLYLHGCWMDEDATYTDEFSAMTRDERKSFVLAEAVKWVTRAAADIVFVEGSKALEVE